MRFGISRTRTRTSKKCGSQQIQIPLALRAAVHYSNRPMNFRPHFLLAAAACTLALAGCKTPYKETDKAREAKKKDASGDHSFQAVLGQLRIAVQKKDFQMLAQLMAPDFGYRWDNAPPDETVFSYWEANNIWPQLDEVLKQQFVPNGDFMVAPPAFGADPDYPGYRAGMKQIGGSWKFAYFVPAPPPGEQALGQ